MFGPPIPAGALFPKSAAFTKFLLTKVINAENAAHRSDKFVSMATRTRQEYLKDLSANYSTQTTIDSGSKFGKKTLSGFSQSFYLDLYSIFKFPIMSESLL